MHEEQYRVKRQIRRKSQRMRSVLKGTLIIGLCVISFFTGRIWTKAEIGNESLYNEGSINEKTKLKDEINVENSNLNLNNGETSIPDDNSSESTDAEADNESSINKKPESNKETKINDWNLILVNSKNYIPDNYSIDLTELKNGQAIDKRAYPDLQDMMDDARAQGLSPVICSSYRTMAKQKSLYNRKVDKYKIQGYSEEEAKIEAGKWVAIPGTSEHQLGLALDIVSTDYQNLDKEQEKTAEQIWLMENSYKYGFILRYPSDKSEITGINYEPWHYRYVGKEIAAEIYERGICLEEYLDAK